MPAGFCSLDFIQALPDEQQTVLIGLAGLGLPAANSHLARVMAATGQLPQARAWVGNPRRLQELLLELKARGLTETTRQGYWTCSERSLESAARLAFARGVLRRLHQGAVSGQGYGSVLPDAFRRCRAELRLAFLEGAFERWRPLRERFLEQFGPATRFRDPLALVCAGPFEPGWFQGLEPAAQAYACQALLLDQALHGLPEPGFLAWLEAQAQTPRASPLAMPILLYLALQGQAELAAAWMRPQPPATRQSYAWPALEGTLALAAGAADRAAAGFGASVDRLRTLTGKPQPMLPGVFEPLHLLALLASGEPQALHTARQRIARLARRDRDDPLQPAAAALERLAVVRSGLAPGPAPGPAARATPLARFLVLLGSHLAGASVPVEWVEQVLRACRALPLGWFATELEHLRDRLGGSPPRPSALLDLLPRAETWELALASMGRLGAPEAEPGPAEPLRLAWFVRPEPGAAGRFRLEPREQRQDARGHWTRGRPVSPGKLREASGRHRHLTPQDLRVLACGRSLPAFRPEDGYILDEPRALAALVGHPLVHWGPEGAEQPVDLLEGQPELLLTQHGQTLELRLEPAPGPGGLAVREDGPGRRRVYLFTGLHQRVAELLGERLVVPLTARERALRAVAAVAPLLPVRTDPVSEPQVGDQARSPGRRRLGGRG